MSRQKSFKSLAYATVTHRPIEIQAFKLIFRRLVKVSQTLLDCKPATIWHMPRSLGTQISKQFASPTKLNGFIAF